MPIHKDKLVQHLGKLVVIRNGPRGHPRNARKEACTTGIVIKVVNSFCMEILWSNGNVIVEGVRDLEMAA